ncbi:MAG TPA: nuclear transport factor 2 family protein [Bryobacteraceae bacterium]|nr:nuclear transport factor 2 family protein [Bryobacteraceae bacterium]
MEGKTAVVAFWREWFARNRDAKFENEEMIVSGDRAVVRWVSRRTQNGRPWRLRGVDIFTVRDGKIAEKLAVSQRSTWLLSPPFCYGRTHGRMTLGAFDEWTRPAPYSSR